MRLNALSVTLVALGSAQVSLAAGGLFLATNDGENFAVPTNKCTNFRKDQPIFNQLIVFENNGCTIFEKRDCIGTGTGYAPGDYEVTDLKLRSVVCYESDAKAAKDGKNLDL
ncbi:hypothetical protein K4F52_006009 [Lecanicillium sp. MT-2017a]|nr:hypothetical protein K4F52_006009 [Lecanicillium sp. MT-2017a]